MHESTLVGSGRDSASRRFEHRNTRRTTAARAGRNALACAAALLFVLGTAASAGAATLHGVLDNAWAVTQGTVEIVFDDMGGSGQIEVTLTVLATPDIGDLRGIYGNIDLSPTELAGLSITGVDITATEFGGVDGRNFGSQARVSATTFCPCDFGAEIGTPGIGFDDIQTTRFILSHATRNLDLSLFAGQVFAVRLANVGLEDGKRISSAKLSGTIPIPEPGTALLMSLGLTGLAITGRKAKTQ